MRISAGDIEITEEVPDNGRLTLLNNFNEHAPISPVSTSPYIPIFECITGKSPVFDPKVSYIYFDYELANCYIQSF